MATEPDAYLRSALLRRATAATLDDEGSGSGSSSGGGDERITAPPRASGAVTRAWVGAEPAEELHCHVCLDVMQQARSLACAKAPLRRIAPKHAQRRIRAAAAPLAAAAAALPLR
jgi:hypothetical protein